MYDTNLRTVRPRKINIVVILKRNGIIIIIMIIVHPVKTTTGSINRPANFKSRQDKEMSLKFADIVKC